MTTQVNRAMAMLLAAACKPLMPELQIPNASTPETATDAAMLIVTYQGKTFNVFVEALLSGEDEQLAGVVDQVTKELTLDDIPTVEVPADIYDALADAAGLDAGRSERTDAETRQETGEPGPSDQSS